ncbi:hypothetical protein GCM10023322_76440 [Rugosimonospora acidiphila]|uniref:DivIVA domain-containing protein n=1 Tax=Rugosimonospora acidiphila TaxID=556531 RepID=A0ABP9SRM0_9ACTN
MSTVNEHTGERELELRELTADNVVLVRRRLLRATSFEEQIEVETYLDTLWSIADIDLRRARARRASSPAAVARVAEIHRLLQTAHDSAAADQVQAAADALEQAAALLSDRG